MPPQARPVLATLFRASVRGVTHGRGRHRRQAPRPVRGRARGQRRAGAHVGAARRAKVEAGAADYFEKDFRREAAASEARLRAEQGQFLGHPNPNALRSSNIQHPIYRRKGTLRSGVSPMGFGV